MRYQYDNKELLAVLLKLNNIHEGNWILTANFTFSAINIGQLPDGTDVAPAGIAAVTGIGIESVPDPLPFSINAAEVNPKTE